MTIISFQKNRLQLSNNPPYPRYKPINEVIMIRLVKASLTAVCILFCVNAAFAADSMKCASKPAQLKSFTKAAADDIKSQLQTQGYQGVKVSVSTRKRAASESVSAPKIADSFGLMIAVTKGTDGKPVLTYTQLSGPSEVECTYEYGLKVRVRYLNTDGKSVSIRYTEGILTLKSPIIFSNDVK